MRATLLYRQLKRDLQQKMKDGVRRIKGMKWERVEREEKVENMEIIS